MIDQEELNDELKKFEEWLYLYSKCKEVTIKEHVNSIKRLFKKLDKSDINKEEVEKYVLSVRMLNKSYTHYINTCKSIEYYFKSKEIIIKFGRPKRPKRIIKDTLTESEITRIIYSCKNSRERAIIGILSYSGIRNLELCNLKIKDLDLGNNNIRVFGKGKERIVNISGDCSRLIIEYLNDYKKSYDDFLFTTINSNNKYETSDLRKLVKIISRRAGIKKRVYPHLFRHSLATNLIRRGANLSTVQNQLGHSFIESTMIYINSTTNRSKTEYDFFLPAYI